MKKLTDLKEKEWDWFSGVQWYTFCFEFLYSVYEKVSAENNQLRLAHRYTIVLN